MQFLLEDPYAQMREDTIAQMRVDIFNLRPYNGFGDISNKAIAINPILSEEYGTLDVLNDGHGVVFYFKADRTAYVQCDGLVKNTAVVLLNEAKTHFHEDDAASLAGRRGPILSSCWSA